MTISRTASCLLGLAAIGCVGGCNARESVAPVYTPKQWESYWIADPFADTRRIEIEHFRDGGQPDRYFIDDPTAVAALLAPNKILGIDNDCLLACETVATLTFVKTDDSAFRLKVECGPGERPIGSFGGGMLYLNPAFVQRLNEHLTAVAGTPVNISKNARKRPERDGFSNATPSRWLDVGFKWVEVDYSVGQGQSHVARIAAQQDLERLRDALQIAADQRPENGQDPQPVQDKHVPLIALGLNDGRRLVGALVNEEQWILAGEHAALHIEPAFAKTLSEILSRLESRPIDVLTENASAEPAAELEEFSKLIDAATSLRVPSQMDPPKTITVSAAHKIENLLHGVKPIEQPLRDASLRAASRAAQVTTKDGQIVELVFHDGDKGFIAAGPAADGLPSVRRQIWVAPQWGSQLFTFEFDRQEEMRKQRHAEATDAVCRDLPLFFDQVISVGISTNQGSTTVPISQVRRFVQALRVEKVEPLTLNTKQWTARIDDLHKGGSTTVKLTPGLGFDLELVEDGPNAALIPNYGRVILSGGRLADFSKGYR